MRHPTGKIYPTSLTHMWERHHEMLRRLVVGEKPIDIAHSMGMTPSRFSIIMNSPIFQARLMEMREKANLSCTDVMQRISKLAVNSMDILERAIIAKAGDKDYVDLKPMERVRTAQDVLDRAGYGAVQKSIAMTGVLTATDIEELKKRRSMRVVSPVEQALAGSAVPPLVSP